MNYRKKAEDKDLFYQAILRNIKNVDDITFQRFKNYITRFCFENQNDSKRNSLKNITASFREDAVTLWLYNSLGLSTKEIYDMYDYLYIDILPRLKP